MSLHLQWRNDHYQQPNPISSLFLFLNYSDWRKWLWIVNTGTRCRVSQKACHFTDKIWSKPDRIHDSLCPRATEAFGENYAFVLMGIVSGTCSKMIHIFIEAAWQKCNHSSTQTLTVRAIKMNYKSRAVLQVRRVLNFPNRERKPLLCGLIHAN